MKLPPAWDAVSLAASPQRAQTEYLVAYLDKGVEKSE